MSDVHHPKSPLFFFPGAADTSPRQLGMALGMEGAWDGACFYLCIIRTYSMSWAAKAKRVPCIARVTVLHVRKRVYTIPFGRVRPSNYLEIWKSPLNDTHCNVAQPTRGCGYARLRLSIIISHNYYNDACAILCI